MNLYINLNRKHQQRVNDFLNKYAFFAFSDNQFLEGMKKLNLAPDDYDKITRITGGGFILKDHKREYIDLAEQIQAETEAAIRDPETGAEFAYQMFYYELCNHEFCITGDSSETLEALGYTREEVMQDEVLKPAFIKAREKAMLDAF